MFFRGLTSQYSSGGVFHKVNNNHIFSVVLLRLFVSERRRGHEETPFFFFCFEAPIQLKPGRRRNCCFWKNGVFSSSN